MRRRWQVAVIAVVLAVAAFAFGTQFSRQSQEPTTDRPGASFEAAAGRLMATRFQDPAGNDVDLSRWRGKPLIINFWATWCPPCLTEMPVFSRLQEKHRQVQFIGIAVDTVDNFRKFATDNSISYPLLLGSQDVMSLMADLGNTRQGLPFMLTIDTNGQLRHRKLGSVSEAEAERFIAELK